MRRYSMSIVPCTQPPEGISVTGLQVGELARVLEGVEKDTILLCVYDGLVSLTDPQHTWLRGRSNNSLPSFRVKKLERSTIVRLVVE